MTVRPAKSQRIRNILMAKPGQFALWNRGPLKRPIASASPAMLNGFSCDTGHSAPACEALKSAVEKSSECDGFLQRWFLYSRHGGKSL
jgi:hypothetical protein